MGTQKTLKGKVLVIDDDTVIRRMLCNALEKLEYETVEAPTGQMGLIEFGKASPDIVITDIMMPDKNGFQTIMEIRSKNPRVRIIAMSGSSTSPDENFLEMATELGAIATISKPFTLDDVKKALEKAAA